MFASLEILRPSSTIMRLLIGDRQLMIGVYHINKTQITIKRNKGQIHLEMIEK